MKNIKRIATLVVAALLVLSMGLLMASCGDEETPSSTTPSSSNSTDSSTNNNTTDSSNPDDGEIDMSNPNLVKVTVVDQKGNPVNGATVQICQGEMCFSKPIVTGSNGVGTREYTLDGSQLKAKILAINGMDDYLVPGELGYVYFQSDSRELTITVRRVTVNVFDQDSKAVEGAGVQLYQGEHAFSDLIYTDADGVAYANIAVSGDEIGAVVTEVLSSGSYKLSSESTLFGAGTYEGTVTVNKLSTYSVKISTMLGLTIENAKVELYDVEKGWKRQTAYTDANGIAKFEDVNPGEYYVKVSIDNPIYKIITESVDGKYYFADGSKVINLDAVQLEKITYTVSGPASLAGEMLWIYDSNHLLDLSLSMETVFDENGVATFEAPYAEYIVECIPEDEGEYAVPVIFTKDGVVEKEMTLKDSAGVGASKDNPYYVVGSFFPTVGQTYEWFAVPFANNKLITVCNYDEAEYTINIEEERVLSDYEITFEGKASDVDTVMLFSIKANNGEFECAIEVSAPGSISSPHNLNEIVGDDIDGKSTTIDLLGGESIYFEYTANEDGTLTVALPYESVIMYFDGRETEMKKVDGNVTISNPVYAGETVVFYVFSMNIDTLEAVEIENAEMSFSFGEVKENYTVTTYVDFETAEGITVILYELNESLELVELARATSDANGVATFADTVYASGYAVAVIPPQDYEATEAYTFFEYATSTQIYMSHIKDGTNEYPYEVDHNTGIGTVTVAENGTAWLYVYVHASFDGTRFMLTIDDANAKFTVYSNDTNDDGRVDENDTPYGTSTLVDGVATYTFVDNGKGYKIALSTENGEASELEYKYASIEAEAGETTDNAKEFDKADSVSETITAGKTVFYRYTGDSGKLTVALTGEGVTLKSVEFDMSGEYTINDVTDNTYVVEDTQGAWIYFAVVAESDTTYELSVTVE